MVTGTNAITSAFRIGAAEARSPGLAGWSIALNTVPSPITTKVMVSETLAWSVLGSSGPATRGSSAATNSTAA